MTLRNDIIDLLREYGPLSSSEIIERTCIDGSEHSNRNKTNACLKKMVDDGEIYTSGYLQHGIAVYSLVNQLKSCPFCGAKAMIVYCVHGIGANWAVECTDTHAHRIEFGGPQEEVIKEWNRRV